MCLEESLKKAGEVGDPLQELKTSVLKQTHELLLEI